MSSDKKKLNFCDRSKPKRINKTFYSPLKITSPKGKYTNTDLLNPAGEKVSKVGFNFTCLVESLEKIGEDFPRTERNSIGANTVGESFSKLETMRNSPVQNEKLKDSYLNFSGAYGKTPDKVRNFRKNSLDMGFNFNLVQRKKSDFALENNNSCVNSPKLSLEKKNAETKEKVCVLQERFRWEEFIKREVLENLKMICEKRDEKQNLMYKKRAGERQVYDEFSYYKSELGKYFETLKQRFFENTKKIESRRLEISKSEVLEINSYFLDKFKPCVDVKVDNNSFKISETSSVAVFPCHSFKEKFHQTEESLNLSRNRISELEKSISILQESLEKAQEDNSSLFNQHKSSLICIKNLQDSIKLLRDENLLIETQSKNAKNTIENLVDRVSVLSGKYENKKRDRKNLAEIVKQLKAELAEAKNCKNNIEENELYKDLYEDLEILRNECRRLSGINKDIMIENEKLKKNSSENNQFFGKMEKENSCLKGDLKNALQSLADLKTEKLKILAVYENVKEELSQVKIENLAYKDTFKLFKDKYEIDEIVNG